MSYWETTEPQVGIASCPDRHVWPYTSGRSDIFVTFGELSVDKKMAPSPYSTRAACMSA